MSFDLVTNGQWRHNLEKTQKCSSAPAHQRKQSCRLQTRHCTGPRLKREHTRGRRHTTQPYLFYHFSTTWTRHQHLLFMRFNQKNINAAAVLDLENGSCITHRRRELKWKLAYNTLYERKFMLSNIYEALIWRGIPPQHRSLPGTKRSPIPRVGSDNIWVYYETKTSHFWLNGCQYLSRN